MKTQAAAAAGLSATSEIAAASGAAEFVVWFVVAFAVPAVVSNAVVEAY